nr:hypothetical protein [Tanacetum cinerariifolium]
MFKEDYQTDNNLNEAGNVVWPIWGIGHKFRSLKEDDKKGIVRTKVFNGIKKDTLWVRWIHLIKLKGRSVWEIDKQSNDSCLWKNLLDLREGVRKHMKYKIGNGCNTSMWHENWSTLPTIDTIISTREIYAAGFSNDASVAYCIDNDRWKWPDQWLVDHPILNQYDVPVLNAVMDDKLMWCSKEGSIKDFSSS